MEDEIAYIGTSTQEVEANTDDEDVDTSAKVATNTSLVPEARSQIGSPHPKVCSAPEDPSEERIKQGTHQGQQIREERNDLSNDEPEDPKDGQNSSPGSPSNDRVLCLVLRVAEDAEENEACGD